MTDLKLPDISEPVVDKATGLMSPNWYRFLALVLKKLNAL